MKQGTVVQTGWGKNLIVNCGLTGMVFQLETITNCSRWANKFLFRHFSWGKVLLRLHLAPSSRVRLALRVRPRLVGSFPPAFTHSPSSRSRLASRVRPVNYPQSSATNILAFQCGIVNKRRVGLREFVYDEEFVYQYVCMLKLCYVACSRPVCMCRMPCT